MVVVIVVVVAIGATWPYMLRNSVRGLDLQRQAYAGSPERIAREKCLNDASRPDLVDALAFARERMPDDARFRLLSESTILPCITLNLLPRRPAPADDFDTTRDWTIWLQAVPEDVVREAVRQQQLPEDRRRYLAHSSEFILVRPAPQVKP